MADKLGDIILGALLSAYPGLDHYQARQGTDVVKTAIVNLVHSDPMTGAVTYDHEIGGLPPVMEHEHLAITTALQQLNNGQAVSEAVAEQVVRCVARLAGITQPGAYVGNPVVLDGRGMTEDDIAAALGKMEQPDGEYTVDVVPVPPHNVDGRVDPYDLPMPVEQPDAALPWRDSGGVY